MKKLREEVRFEIINPDEKGGQCCGMRYSKMRLISDDLDVVIETGYFKSNFQNKEFLLKMFDAALNELVK